MAVPPNYNVGTAPQFTDYGVFPATNLTHASAATDAAAASVGNIGTQVWRAPDNITIVSAWHEPTGADQPAADAASYRTFSLRVGGNDGTGTRILASSNLTASQGSNTTRALTLGTNLSVNRGEVVYGAYSATAGGTHAGTVVRAGHFSFSWRPL
jgi:hypothetical protein